MTLQWVQELLCLSFPNDRLVESTPENSKTLLVQSVIISRPDFLKTGQNQLCHFDKIYSYGNGSCRRFSVFFYLENTVHIKQNKASF